jgi:formamidopyrimidine-DNA glycosylase
VEYRGNVVHVRFDGGMNLLVAPEYGGKVNYVESGGTPDYHFRARFTDGSAFVVRLTSMGCVIALNDEELADSYMYKRDFGEIISPRDEEFTLERFSMLMAEKNRMLKSVLVGKDAILVGMSNATYQDVIFRAGLHPKRKASSLSGDEIKALFTAIMHVIEERIRLKGKVKFQDIYGVEGGYVAAMGPNMKGKSCPECETQIEGIQHGGGKVYICPKCQQL